MKDRVVSLDEFKFKKTERLIKDTNNLIEELTGKSADCDAKYEEVFLTKEQMHWVKLVTSCNDEQKAFEQFSIACLECFMLPEEVMANICPHSFESAKDE